MGKSVILVEPSSRLGGLTTGGLGQTDIGNKRVIGGLARSFYEGIKQHYDQPQHWTWQKKRGVPRWWPDPHGKGGDCHVDI